jgi:hypothetical protein
MKCGICGNTERIMFEKNISYYGKDSQKRDSNGEPIKQLNDDGSVQMRPIYDASDMTEHKRFEHPAEVEAIALKRQMTKRTNAQLKEVKDNNIAKVRRTGQQAVAVPTISYDDHWQFRRVGPHRDSAYFLTTSYAVGHAVDVARRAVGDGHGEEAVWYGGMNDYRQIGEDEVTELNALDQAIRDLQERRDTIAANIYKRGTSLTHQHMVDLDDAATAAQQEFERMLNDGDELDADEGRLTDSAVEDIVEAAMANQPTKFIAYSAETMAEALGAYGY